MSWYGGSQIMALHSAESSKHRRMHAELWSSFAWQTITPLGEAVERDVYCRSATLCPPTSGGSHVPAVTAAAASLVSQRVRSTSGCRRNSSTTDANAAVVSTSVASLSRR